MRLVQVGPGGVVLVKDTPLGVLLICGYVLVPPLGVDVMVIGMGVLSSYTVILVVGNMDGVTV